MRPGAEPANPRRGVYVSRARRHDDEIDIRRASAARLQNFLLGGATHFAIDRLVAEEQAAAVGGLDNLRAIYRANELFLEAGVRWLVDEVGIRQFVQMGCGLPRRGQKLLHQVIQEAATDCRVLYVDPDPIVLAHAHELVRRCTPDGAVAYLCADIREPELILDRAEMMLDLDQPVGLLLGAILHQVPDGDDPHQIVKQLVELLPSGSYLVVTHLAADVDADAMKDLAKASGGPDSQHEIVVRARDEVARFLVGTEPVRPGGTSGGGPSGTCSLERWLPVDAPPATRMGARVWWCAVGTKITRQGQPAAVIRPGHRP
jgi:SAM-dependent methyltransferase